MSVKLNSDDVKLLMEEPSAENRAVTAEKLASDFGTGELTENERHLAEDIFRIMVKDAEERVRSALSHNLKSATALPHDVAMNLAKDISDTVAVPMLQFSDVLTDADLIEIVRTQPPERQVAVASRPEVSEDLASAIVDHGTVESVSTLVSNEGAKLNEPILSKVVDTFGDHEMVQGSLVERSKLPVTVAERLVAKVSDHLREQLIANHELSDSTATDLILQSRERATISLVSGGAEEKDVEDLISELRRNGRLSPTIILRALCLGDLSFFEASLAALARIPLVNARILTYDQGDLGLKNLYQKANLPKALYPAFRSAMDVVLKTQGVRSDEDPERHMRRILERVLTERHEIVQEYGSENLDYLLRKFAQMSPVATVEAEE